MLKNDMRTISSKEIMKYKHLFFEAYVLLMSVTSIYTSEGFCVTQRTHALYTNRRNTITGVVPFSSLSAATDTSSLAVAAVGTSDDQQPTIQPLCQKQQPLQVITSITSIPQFLNFVTQDMDDDVKQLCVIQYHASWCKVCRLVAAKYKKIATEYTTTTTNSTRPLVRFADVEVGKNAQLCQTLGIRVFPFIEMYEGGVKVASFSTGASYKFNSIVGKSIQEKLAMSKEGKLEFLQRYQDEILESSKAFDSLYQAATFKNKEP